MYFSLSKPSKILIYCLGGTSVDSSYLYLNRRNVSHRDFSLHVLSQCCLSQSENNSAMEMSSKLSVHSSDFHEYLILSSVCWVRKNQILSS